MKSPSPRLIESGRSQSVGSVWSCCCSAGAADACTAAISLVCADSGESRFCTLMLTSKPGIPVRSVCACGTCWLVDPPAPSDCRGLVRPACPTKCRFNLTAQRTTAMALHKQNANRSAAPRCCRLRHATVCWTLPPLQRPSSRAENDCATVLYNVVNVAEVEGCNTYHRPCLIDKRRDINTALLGHLH